MQRRSKPLGKPFRTPGHRKKFAVYVKNPKTGKIVIVRFGDPGLKIKQRWPERRKNFRARHRCDEQTDRMTPAYWSCRWGWPKHGKPRLQASESITKASAIKTSPSKPKRSVIAMKLRSFYVKTGDRSAVFTASKELKTLSGRKSQAAQYMLIEARYKEVVQALKAPDTVVVIRQGKVTGTLEVFGIRPREGSAPRSTSKSDWDRSTAIIPGWIEFDLIPTKIGSLLVGFSESQYTAIDNTDVYEVADCHGGADCIVTNLKRLQTQMPPIAEFTTRSRSRHLMFPTPVTEQVIGPPGQSENLSELTVYLNSVQTDKFVSEIQRNAAYTVMVTPQLGNNMMIQVISGNLVGNEIDLDQMERYTGLNVPRANMCPILLYGRISNQRSTMRFRQAVVDSEITSLVKTS